jgi:PilZ domain
LDLTVDESDKKPSNEGRDSIRTKLRAEVKFSHPEVGDLKLHTENISNSGAYILAEGHPLPRVGELVAVQVQGIGAGEAPTVTMRIVRLDNDGMGLEFVSNNGSNNDAPEADA